jgi:hypothetical protein
MICELVRQPVTVVLPQSHDVSRTIPPDLALRLGKQPLRPPPLQRSYMKRLENITVYDPDGNVVPRESETAVFHTEVKNQREHTSCATDFRKMNPKESTDNKLSSIGTSQPINDQGTASATSSGQMRRLSRIQQVLPPFINTPVEYSQVLPYQANVSEHHCPLGLLSSPKPDIHFPPQSREGQFRSMEVTELDQLDRSIEIGEEEVRQQEEKVRQIREKVIAARLKSRQKNA